MPTLSRYEDQKAEDMKTILFVGVLVLGIIILIIIFNAAIASDTSQEQAQTLDCLDRAEQLIDAEGGYGQKANSIFYYAYINECDIPINDSENWNKAEHLRHRVNLGYDDQEYAEHLKRKDELGRRLEAAKKESKEAHQAIIDKTAASEN